MGWHAVVLLKQVLDPDVPPVLLQVDPEHKRLVSSAAWHTVTGPFDLNALEVALQLKDEASIGRITAMTIGPSDATETLRKAIALGADDALHLVVREDEEGLDPVTKAQAFAHAIGQLDGVDLVFAGRASGDSGHGQLGPVLAEALGWPCIAYAYRASAGDGRLILERERDGERHTLSVTPPAIITVTNHGGNRLRVARVPDVIRARRRTIPQMPIDNVISNGGVSSPRWTLLDLRIVRNESQCDFIEGESAEEVADKLVTRLVELKIFRGD